MTRTEHAAIKLHDFLWRNCGQTDDWPVRIISDGAEVCEKLNDLTQAIKHDFPDFAPPWPIPPNDAAR